jgi:hypothetical protein
MVGQKFGITTAACHSSIAKTVVFPKHALTNYRSKLSPAGAFQALMPGFNGIDAGGLGSYVFVSVPACRDPRRCSRCPRRDSCRRRSPPRTTTSA